MRKQIGSVAVEYLILMVFFAVFALSNLDDIEDKISVLEDSITAEIQALIDAFPSLTITDN